MTEFDARYTPGDRIIYRVEVYKLDYDAEDGIFCEDLAFCAGYDTYDEAREAVECVESICAHIEPGWNSFTTAAVLKVNLDKGIRSEPLGEWRFCSDNVKKIGKTPAQLEGDWS